jgi:hypothetical protein
MKAVFLLAALMAVPEEESCANSPAADKKQALAQEQSLEQANAAVGMPAITNFQEMRMVKDLYELRDKAIGTHAYIFNEMQGCLIYLGPSVGYGLPYATQFSSPEKDIYAITNSGVHHNMPQAEPNGLFMPAAAEGTWIMLKDPNGDAVKPIYVEPRVVVSPFRLETQECQKKEAAVAAKKP